MLAKGVRLKSSILIGEWLSALDVIVFILVLAFTAFSVWLGQRRAAQMDQESQEAKFWDLLLMGRRLSLPLFVCTLVATWYGGIFGVTQLSFEKGVYNFLTQGVFWYAAYLIFAFFLVSKARNSEAATLPELVGKIFGRRSRFLAAIFNFMNVIPIAYAMSLGFFIQALLGWSFEWALISGVGFVVLYSIWGGFRSVVFSDVVQFAVMCFAVASVVVFSFLKFGGSNYLQSSLPPTHFDPLGGQGLATTFVWGFIALSTLVDPNFYQRVFAAKNVKVAKRGILISTCVWIVFDLCTTLGGLYARAALSDADSGSAYMTYSLQVLPSGFRGLFLAGILATILSTMDSYLFTSGTTLTYDLLSRWHNKSKRRLIFNHMGVILSALVAIVLSLHFDGQIRLVWKTLGSYSAACLLLPVMWGLLFRGRISDWQFSISCLSSALAVTIWRLWDKTGFYAEIDELYVGVLVSALVLLLWSAIRFWGVFREGPSVSSKSHRENH